MAWLVSTTGVDTNPVISTIGSITGSVGANNFNSIGYLKASAEGDRITTLVVFSWMLLSPLNSQFADKRSN